MNPKLKRCSPLTDVVKVAETFMRANMFLTFGSVAIALLGMVLLNPDSAQDVGANAVIAGVVLSVLLIISLPMLKAVLLVMRETKKPQDLCLFLRAFRSDATSDQLRAWLKASLGTHYKLSGIRPPKERASAWLTFLSPVITGLRYAGSRQFELEAPDRNWMARLLATFAQARFVCIDVRDTTPHVLDEIRLAWQVFGPQRIIFIIDNTRSEPEWIFWIGQMLEIPIHAPNFHFLDWPSRKQPEVAPFLPVVRTSEGIVRASRKRPEPASFLNQLQSLLTSIPKGPVQVPDTAVAFVETKVAPRAWNLRFTERPWVFVISSMVGVSLLMQGILFVFPNAQMHVTAGMLGLLQIFFWLAWNRARRQRKFARQINPSGPPSAGRVWGAAFCMLSSMGMLVGLTALAITTFSFVNMQAQKTRANMQCRQIILMMQMYATDFGSFPGTGINPDTGEKAATSNAAFRELFQAKVAHENDERVFGDPQGTTPPDGKIGSPPLFEEALKPGENRWALTADQLPYSIGNMPLVFEAPVDASWPPRWDVHSKDKTKKGAAWADKTIIIGFVDGSVESVKLDADGYAIRAGGYPVFPQEGGPYQILDAEPTLEDASTRSEVTLAPPTPAPQTPPDPPSSITVPAGGIPFAIPIPGKPGIVRSPFQNDKLIDVRGMNPGSKVRDPESGKIFRVP